MDLAARYVTRCHELTGYWGSWPPGNPIRVGLVGSLSESKIFRRLKELGDVTEIPAQEIVEVKTDFNESWYDGGETAITTSAAVAANAQSQIDTSMNVNISFEEDCGIFLAYSGATHEQIRDIDLLKRQILALTREKIWKPDWAVIVETIRADHLTALVSSRSNASITLNLRAEMGKFQAWHLARGDLGVSVKSQKAIGLESIGTSGTPLYRAIVISKTWLRKPKVVLSGEASADDAFEDAYWIGAADGDV
ncbi:hypothetical protein [Streptomyces erythrochromogenes]|uniref:hypothetical protein n=1 Tax=Streptomyces erythrochromogenes TaxID=285574 RepID=UPI00225AB90A|nr:hypothetical protein [Streptomyces erythrochromogenes]MCX5583441.1 hypothetical protein [Streptomyces erythrochromogenes]